MQSIIEIIQALARQRTRGETGPLVMLRQFDGAAGERISHLPVEGELSQAWLAMAGEPFRPHQAQALSALRRGEPVVLSAASPAIGESACLLMYATLLGESGSTGLFLLPDMTLARTLHGALDQINGDLPQNLRLGTTLIETHSRPNPYARIVIATPDVLHSRLLRHHERAWSLFWPRLRLVALPDLHRYTGAAGSHLADLLLRLQRVAAAHNDGHLPNMLGTLHPLSNPQPALTALLGQPWRLVAGDDVPYDSTTLAIWRGSADRLREAGEVALGIQRQGYGVHIICQPLEAAALAPMVGGSDGITLGPDPLEAQVVIAAGYPGSHAALRRLLRSSYQAVVVVLGDTLYEQSLARHTEALLQDPPPSWPEPQTNAYVTAQHLLCAASELPLTESEVDSWGVQHIVERLASHDQLVDLPDPEVAWKPGIKAGDPYVEFSLLSSSGGPILARNDQGRLLAQLDPTGFERWTFAGAALPPGAGGLRVTERDEEAGTVTLRLESSGRRTFPLRRCRVEVREERDSRALFGSHRIAWGRVVVEEEVYGFREVTPGGAATDSAINPPLKARWVAPACWLSLASGVQVLGQLVGWSLAAALPARALAAFTDVVPCYDHEARQLFIVDSQPGGGGLAVWLYQQAEELLPLAYDIALACRHDPLLEQLCRVDMDWLLALLGRRVEQPVALELPRASEGARLVPRVEPPRRTEVIDDPPVVPRRPEPAEPPAAPRRLERLEIAPPRRPEPVEPPARRTTPAEPPVPLRREQVEPPFPTRRGEQFEPLRRGEPIELPPPAPAQEAQPTAPAAPRRAEVPDQGAEWRATRPDEGLPTAAPAEPDWGGEDRAIPQEPRQEPPPMQPAPNGARPPRAQASNRGSARTEAPRGRRANRAAEQAAPPARHVPEPPPERSPAAPARRAPEPPERSPVTSARRAPEPPPERNPVASARRAPEPPPADLPPDPAALIARLRQRRQQKEAENQAAQPRRAAPPRQVSNIEPRFTEGDMIFCLPYGEGEVRASRIDDGREILAVSFPDYGELTIDPAVSLVRKLEQQSDYDDDLL